MHLRGQYPTNSGAQTTEPIDLKFSVFLYGSETAKTDKTALNNTIVRLMQIFIEIKTTV